MTVLGFQPCIYTHMYELLQSVKVPGTTQWYASHGALGQKSSLRSHLLMRLGLGVSIFKQNS